MSYQKTSGEPVAWLAQAVGKGGEVYRNTASTTEITMRDVGFAWGQGVIDRFTIVIKPLYAEQPAPVAVTLSHVLTAYDYAESHPHKYLRGTSNWCAAMAYKLNACLDEATRLNTK